MRWPRRRNANRAFRRFRQIESDERGHPTSL
jgi:hypothetical protein